MLKPLTILAAAAAIVAMAPAAAQAQTGACTRTLHATFSGDYIATPDRSVSGVTGNGCVTFDKMHPLPSAQGRCQNDPAHLAWAYDDTNWSHPDDAQLLDACYRFGGHSGAAWRKYEFVTYRQGSFKFVVRPWITRYYTQLYTHLGQVANPTVSSAWAREHARNRNVAPTINIGASVTNAAIQSAIRSLCAVSTVQAIGFYTRERIADANPRRNLIVSELNRCAPRAAAPAPVVDRAPIATHQEIRVPRNQWLAFHLAASDDKPGLRFEHVSQSFASANLNFRFNDPVGGFTLKVPPNHPGGRPHFTYRVVDSKGQAATAMVTLVIG